MGRADAPAPSTSAPTTRPLASTSENPHGTVSSAEAPSISAAMMRRTCRASDGKVKVAVRIEQLGREHRRAQNLGQDVARRAGDHASLGEEVPACAHLDARPSDVDVDGVRLPVAVVTLGLETEQVIPGQLA